MRDDRRWAKGCLSTPSAGKTGRTNIPKWKFDAIRGAIMDVLGRRDLPFADLPAAVKDELDEDALSSLGSLGWHVTTVKLELEVRGEIVRRQGKGRQIIGLP